MSNGQQTIPKTKVTLSKIMQKLDDATKTNGILDNLITNKTSAITSKIDTLSTKQELKDATKADSPLGQHIDGQFTALTKSGGALETLIGTHDKNDPNKDTGLYEVIHHNFTDLIG